MSRYVVLGLFAEGPSDFRFLLDLLAREAFDLVGRRGTQPVIVGEPIVRLDGRSVEDRARIACENESDVDVFIVHGDASRAARGAVSTLVLDGLRQQAKARCALDEARFVGLLPAREMEAWALCDEDAIAQACGYVAWPSSRPVPWAGEDIERIEDPKRMLDDAVAGLLGRRKRGRVTTAAAFLDAIGERVRLERLRRLDSYRQFASDLSAAFDSLGLLRAE